MGLRPPRRTCCVAEDTVPGTGQLVLLPALLCDAELWRDQVAALEGRWRCHVADLTQGNTLASLARSVLDQAAPRFALAAFSFGGYVAQEILRMAPDRVERLALVGTGFERDTPARHGERLAAVRAAQNPGRFEGITDRLLQRFVHPDRLADRLLVERIRTMTMRVGREVFIRQSLVDRQDGTGVLQAVRCPTLVLCGMQDKLTSLESHRRMAALIPGARLRSLDRCGHMAPMEQPDAVTVILRDWLCWPGGTPAMAAIRSD